MVYSELYNILLCLHITGSYPVYHEQQQPGIRTGAEAVTFVHIGVPNIVLERLTERVLVHWISVLTRPEYLLPPQRVPVRTPTYSPPLRNKYLFSLHQSVTQTYLIYDASPWRQASCSLAPLQKSRQNNLFYVWTQALRYLIWFWCWGLFLESPANFSGPESCFLFVVFAFKFKVSIILKIIQWNC